MVLTMLSTAKTSQDPKQIIYSLVGTLTELDPNIIEINHPIEQSNAFIKEVTLEIEQLNTKNKLIKIGHLAVLEQKLPELKKSIDVFIAQLTFGKMDAEKVSHDFINVIESLVKATDKLSETDPLKTDALSIISLNNLKLKNIQNQITAATNQITLLERFKSITLYHLTDTINNNKVNKELPLNNELRRVLKNLKKEKKHNVIIGILAITIAGYNYLATKYYYVSEHIEKIPQQFPSASTSLSSMVISPLGGMTESIINILDTFCMFISVLSLVIVGFGLMMRSAGPLVAGMLAGIISTFAPFILESFFDTDPVTYIEKTVTEYYEFFNLGIQGTIVFLGLACIYFFLAHSKSKRTTQYDSLISKLDNETVTKEPENFEISQKPAV